MQYSKRYLYYTIMLDENIFYEQAGDGMISITFKALYKTINLHNTMLSYYGNRKYYLCFFRIFC